MSRTDEENNLLQKLASGSLDGMVGDEREYRGYRSVYCGKYIKNGEPVSYRQGEREEEHFDTDDRKLEFLQRYGWLMDDEDVKAYSAKYKPSK